MGANTTIMEHNKAILKLNRMAYEIAENHLEEKQIILAGIKHNGSTLAQILKDKIEEISHLKVILTEIDIDKSNPINCKIEMGMKLDGACVIIVDDVADSGRTAMYALRPFLSFITKKIQVAVLFDRRHKLFPVTADFVGTQLSTSLQEKIIVNIKEGKISAEIMKK